MALEFKQTSVNELQHSKKKKREHIVCCYHASQRVHQDGLKKAGGMKVVFGDRMFMFFSGIALETNQPIRGARSPRCVD